MDQSSRRHGSQDICGTLWRLIPFKKTGNGKSGIIWSHCISSAYILYTVHNDAYVALLSSKKKKKLWKEKQPAAI